MPHGRRGFGAIRKLPSGRFQASYVGPDGKRHNAPTTFKAQLDAEAWLARRREEITDGRWTPRLADTAPVPTFAEYAAAWVENRRRPDGRPLAPSTRSHYRRIVTDRLTPTFGEYRMNELTADLVRRWHATYALDRPTIRAHTYAVLRGICETAVEDELLAANPCTIKGAGRASRATRTRIPTMAELSTIVDHMPERLRAAVVLSAWAALRFGECFELRRKDLDMKQGMVKVRRAVTRVDGQVIVGPPKSEAGKRDVHLPPHILPDLQHHLDAYSQPGRDGLVFPSEKGQHYHPATVQHGFYAAREAADRADLRWHDLRHFGATQAARAGATLKELQARIGHSTPAAALRYQHAAAERDAEIARRLSELAGESGDG